MFIIRRLILVTSRPFALCDSYALTINPGSVSAKLGLGHSKGQVVTGHGSLGYYFFVIFFIGVLLGFRIEIGSGRREVVEMGSGVKTGIGCWSSRC